MKKLLTLFLFTTLSIAVTTTADAQYQAGAGLIYGSEINSFGLKGEGFYTINEDFRVGAAIGYFFPDRFPGGSLNWFEIDANLNYNFYEEDDLTIYGLTGLNLAIWSFNYDNIPNQSSSELGLNLGAGLEYGLDFGNLFGELKLAGIGGSADQLVLGAGVRFRI